jgi:hypothetical protein
MDFGKIVLYSVVAALGFGFLYEGISAWACVEYFTLGQGRLMILQTASPLWIGVQFAFLGWSWVGGALGCALAVAGRIGGEIQIKPGFFVRPLVALYVLVSVVASAGALIGHHAEVSRRYPLMTNWAGGLAPEKHAPYVALTWSHIGAYTAALMTGAALVAWTWRKRRIFTQMSRTRR